MGVQPLLGTQNNLIEFLRLRRALELRLTLALLNPEDSVIRIAVDGLVVQALIPAEREGVNDGQKLPDIVGAVDRSEMKHPIARLQVDGLILHRPGITATGRIHSPRIRPYVRMQRQYGIIPIIRRVAIIINHLSIIIYHLHPLRHFDAKQTHAILDDLGYILCQYKAEELLLLIGLVEDRVVVIELIEHLGELVAVVGDA